MKRDKGTIWLRILFIGLAILGLITFFHKLAVGDTTSALKFGVFAAAMLVAASQQRQSEVQEEGQHLLVKASPHLTRHFQYQRTIGQLCVKAIRQFNADRDAPRTEALLNDAVKRAWYKEDQGAVLYLRAIMEDHQGRKEDAIRTLRQSVELDKDHAEAWNMLGFLLVKTKGEPGYDEAGRAYRRAIALAPDNQYIWNNLGTFYCRSGDLREARKWLEKALTSHPLPATLSSLAVLEAREGNEQAAWDYYSRAENVGYQYLDNLKAEVTRALANSRRRTSAAEKAGLWERYNKEWHAF